MRRSRRVTSGEAADAEGYVPLRWPVAVERGDKMGKALLAIGLGLINPVLAFIPFAVGKNQILVTLLRLDDLDKGRQVAVTIVGDAQHHRRRRPDRRVGVLSSRAPFLRFTSTTIRPTR